MDFFSINLTGLAVDFHKAPVYFLSQDAVQLNADGKVWFASWLVADNLFDKEALLNDHIYEFSWSQRPDLFCLYSR